jgi:hypothetical protein
MIPVELYPDSVVKYTNYDDIIETLPFPEIYIQILNSPPVANANGPYETNEGMAILFDASDSADPNMDTLNFRWDFNNDGTWETSYLGDSKHSYSYYDDYSDLAKVEAFDGEAADFAFASVQVNNVPPIITKIDGAIDPVNINNPAEITGYFIDPGTLDTHTAIFDWGDSTTTEYYLQNHERAVIGAHTYNQPGVYIVTLEIIDDDGGSDTEISQQYVVIYDPDGGFVTGGGWIDSPEGSYISDSTLTGKANFGFIAKYKKGAETPIGNTEFQFHIADLNFHSEDYQWLVVAGARAQFKGTGTINGAGDYGFMLTAIDAKLTSSTDIDMFRIRIWDKETDTIVYDNMLGVDDDKDLDDTTKLSSGSIVIHKG